MSIRPSRTFSVLGSVACAFALMGCWGVEEEPVGLAESYRPKYTEAKGTLIRGEHFPLHAGAQADLGGSFTGTLRVTVNGVHLGRRISIDSSATFDFPFALSIRALPSEPVTLSRGTVEAVPVTFSVPALDGLHPTPIAYGQATAYFAAADKGIYLVGFGDGRGGVKEAPAPLHLKLPLTVGDSWESTVSYFPDLSFAGITGQVHAHARTFVVGRESVDLGGRTVEAVRLEQVADFHLTGASVQGVAVGVKGYFKGVTHLAEGLGQVRQQVFLRASAHGSVAQNGEKLVVAASLDLAGDIRAGISPLAELSHGAGPRGVSGPTPMP